MKMVEKPIMILFIGPNGTGKSTIAEHLMNKNKENFFVVRTVVASPLDMRQEFEKNKHFSVITHSEYRKEAAGNSFAFMWKEYLEKQIQYDPHLIIQLEKEDTKSLTDEEHNFIYKSITASDINNALATGKIVVMNLSNSFMYKTKDNFYIDSKKRSRFNLLKEVIEVFEERCKIKV